MLHYTRTVVTVGFEESSYSVSEMDGTVEVCVIMTNPPPDEDFTFHISLQHRTRTGTAGICKHDMTGSCIAHF